MKELKRMSKLERERERGKYCKNIKVCKSIASIVCSKLPKKNIYFLLRQTIGESTDAQKDEVDSSKIDTVRIEQLG